MENYADIACCQHRLEDMASYFVILSRCPYEESSKNNRKLIGRVIRHLQSCNKCFDGYEYINDIFNELNELPEKERFLSQGEIKMLKRNERYMGLVK